MTICADCCFSPSVESDGVLWQAVSSSALVVVFVAPGFHDHRGLLGKKQQPGWQCLALGDGRWILTAEQRCEVSGPRIPSSEGLVQGKWRGLIGATTAWKFMVSDDWDMNTSLAGPKPFPAAVKRVVSIDCWCPMRLAAIGLYVTEHQQQDHPLRRQHWENAQQTHVAQWCTKSFHQQPWRHTSTHTDSNSTSTKYQHHSHYKHHCHLKHPHHHHHHHHPWYVQRPSTSPTSPWRPRWCQWRKRWPWGSTMQRLGLTPWASGLMKAGRGETMNEISMLDV